MAKSSSGACGIVRRRRRRLSCRLGRCGVRQQDFDFAQDVRYVTEAANSVRQKLNLVCARLDVLCDDYLLLRDSLVKAGVLHPRLLEELWIARRMAALSLEAFRCPAVMRLFDEFWGTSTSLRCSTVSRSAYVAWSAVRREQVARRELVACSEGSSGRASPTSLAIQRRGLVGRLFGTMLGWSETNLSLTSAQMITALPLIVRHVGRHAGFFTSVRMCEASRATAEALRPVLTELSAASCSIYVCGGKCDRAALQQFHHATQRWEPLPPMTQRRWACSIAPSRGKLYVIGGVDVPLPGGAACAPECFDPATTKWTLLPSIGEAHTHAVAVAMCGGIYIFGGLSQGSVLDRTVRFDPGCNDWRIMQAMPTARFECAAAAMAGRIYLLGGANCSGDPLPLAECYSPHTDTWQLLPPLGKPRYGGAAAAVGGLMYMVGGHGFWENVATVEVFDPGGGGWQEITSLSVPRGRCGATAALGKIHVFGGSDNGGEGVVAVDRLDPTNRTWSLINTRMPQAFNRCIAIALWS